MTEPILTDDGQPRESLGDDSPEPGMAMPPQIKPTVIDSNGPTVPSDAAERKALADALWPEAADAKLMPVSDQVRRRAALALRATLALAVGDRVRSPGGKLGRLSNVVTVLFDSSGTGTYDVSELTRDDSPQPKTWLL